MVRLNSVEELTAFRLEARRQRDPVVAEIAVCGDTGCRAWGADDVIARFEEEIARQGLNAKTRVKRVGCPGFCERGPLVMIQPHGIFYQRVCPDDVPEVISETLSKYNILGRLLYADPDTDKRYIYTSEVPFYSQQERVVLSLNGVVDPTSIEDAITFGGYSALEEVLSWEPDRVIDVIERAKLRGRGGGGFPTGTKWRLARSAQADGKFIICNADEGDPGAFMDRAILEGNPHSVLEGMLIGAYAMGAQTGYIYCRAEYPLAIERLQRALEQAQALGLLGQNILGAPFDFTIRLYQGAGAFVCGEETRSSHPSKERGECRSPGLLFPSRAGSSNVPPSSTTWKPLPIFPVSSTWDRKSTARPARNVPPERRSSHSPAR